MLLIYFIATTLAGYIQIQDIQLDYTNSGYATQFTLPIQLSNPLPSFGYLKVVFPFSLHYTSTNGIPDGMATYYNTANGQCGQLTKLTSNLFVTSEANTYYIQFFDTNNNPTQLQSNLFYFVTITTSGNNVNIQNSGLQAPIALYTVSSLSSTGMIIDLNPTGHVFGLDLAPSQELIVTVTQNGFYSMNDFYTINVQLQLKKQLNEGARIQLKAPNGFQFEQNCTIVSLQSNCLIQGNQVQLTLDGIFTVNTILNIIVGVRNPLYVTPLTSITAMTMFIYANTIVEINQSNNILQVKQLNLASNSLQLGWGLEYSSRSSYFYPFPIVVQRGHQSGLYNPYNAFRWTFSLNVDLSAEIQLQLEIQTPMKYQSFLMPGSISHNLPAFTGTFVTCYFVNQTKLSSSKIVCKNIGQLYQSIEYFVGCRASFPYDQFNLPLEQKFGSLNIYTVTNSQVDQYSLIVEANPVQYIQTENNPEWLVTQGATSFGSTIVSSQPSSLAYQNPSTYQLGIKPNLVDGEIELISLNFNMAVKISDIITTAVAAPTGVPNANILNSAGIVIVANSNIQISNQFVPQLSVNQNNGQQWFKYQYRESTIASFLEMTVGSNDIVGLVGMFSWNLNETQGKYNYFQISNCQIKFQSSLYADEFLLDFYFGVFDQINSVYPIFKYSYLTNAYTITSSKPANIRLGIVNYYTGSKAGNSGNYFPTILRLTGYFLDTDVEDASNQISVFFTSMIPFYQSQTSETNNKVSCSFTGQTQTICNYFPAGSIGNGQSYMNYERIDIVFESIPKSQEDSFQLLIPMQNLANSPTVQVFLGAVIQNPLYTTANLIQLRTVYRLTGGNTLQTDQLPFAIQSTLLGTSFFLSGILSPQYNLQTSGLIVGTNSTTFTFNIGHQDANNLVIANDATNSASNGGGFTLTSTSQFTTSDTSYSTTISISSNPMSACQSFSYIQSYSQNSPNYKYVIYCPMDQGSESQTTILTLSASNLPFVNGVKLPANTAYCWSDKNRGLVTFQVDSSSLIPNPGVLKIQSVTPDIIRNVNQQQLIWSFTTPNPIPVNGQVRVEFNTLTTYLSVINQGSRCQIVNTVFIQHTCTVTYSATTQAQITFTITNCSGCPIPAGTIQVTQWGVDSQDSIVGVIAPISFTIRTLSQAANTIDVSTVMGTLTYDTYQAQIMYLGNLKLQFYNKRAYGTMQVDFQVSRNIWKNEYILIDMGGFFNDNQRTKSNLVCYVLDSNGLPSTLWSNVDFSLDPTASLQGAKIFPNQDIQSSLTFTFKCNGAIMPFSYNPAPMVAYLMLQNSYTQIQASGSIQLDNIIPNSETSFAVQNINLISKFNNVPGSETDLLLNFTSSLVNISLGTTIYIVFPTKYPIIISNLTYCQINSQFVACSVMYDYTLVLKNFNIAIQAGRVTQIRVFGALQSNLYDSNANQIFVAVTNNADTTVLQEYGVIYDLIPQDMKLSAPQNIIVQWLNVSNNYIRTTSNQVFKIKLPPGAMNKGNVLQVDFPTAWDMIINYKLPSCTVFDFFNKTNYAESCSNFGNRITIIINQTDFLGSSFYFLNLSNVRNPDYGVCRIDTWVITVIKSDGSYVYGRSNPPNYNIQNIAYVSNPNQVTLTWIDLTTFQQIQTLYIQTGVFSGLVGLATDYGAFIGSFYFSTLNNQFITNPNPVSAGYGYQFASFSVAGTNLAVQGLQLIEFTKTGDQNLHTQPPFLRAFLSQSNYQLKTEQSTYLLTLGGQSLPIFFNLSSNQPASNLRIDATVQGNTIYFVSKSSISFGPSGGVGAFLIAAQSSGLNVGDSGSIQFQVSGTYSSYFSQLSSVGYRIVDVTNSNPTINLTSILTQRGSNYLTFQASCSQYATIYWYLSINGSQILFSKEIYSKVLAFPTVDISSSYDQHFGLVNSYVALYNYTIFATPLRPLTIYNMTAVCVNTQLQYSSSKSVLSTTTSNGGKSFYFDFIFLTGIDLQFSQSILCFLTKYFKIPARLIRDNQNQWCSIKRRILATSPTANYSETNVRIYVSLIDYLIQDTYTSNIFSNQVNVSDLKTGLYQYVAGLPTLQKISQFSPIQTYSSQFTEDFKVNITNSSITITNITLDSTGFIYFMIDWSNLTKYPTFYDIRQGNSSWINWLGTLVNKTIPIYYTRLRYNATSNLNFTFMNLTHYSNYTLFYYASNDDPSEHQYRTYVYNISFRTKPNYISESQILIIIILFILI